MLVYRFDENSKHFVEDVWYLEEQDPLPEFHTDKPVPTGMLNPTYLAGVWEEGATKIEVTLRSIQLKAQQGDTVIAEQKSAGKAYEDTGVTVPFRSADALAMLQVKAAFEVGVANTNIKFSNGEVLYMTSTDFPVFATWFANERNKFFL